MHKNNEKMNKATFEFRLPEQRQEFEDALHGGRFRMALSDMDDYLRDQVKYNDKLSDEAIDALQMAREKLGAILEEYSVTIEPL